MKSLPFIALAAFGLASVAPVAQAQTREPLTPEVMWSLKRIGDPSLSPDGREAVVPVTTFDAKTDARDGDLYVIPTGGGPARRLTFGGGAESDPQWSPDGRFIAFVARREGDAASQIYVLPVGGGEARRLTSVPTGASNPRWLPDSSGLVFVSSIWPELQGWAAQAERMKQRADSKMTAMAWDKPPVTYWDRFVDDREGHFFLARLEGGEVQAITQGRARPFVRELGPEPFDISPDGREIAFQADVDETGVRPNLDVFTMPIVAGEARNWSANNPANDTEPTFSPDGRHIAWRQQRIYGFYADIARLALGDRRTGAVRILTEGWDRSADGLVWSPDGQSLYGSIDDAATRRVYRFDLRGGAPQPITQANDFSGLAIAGSGRSTALVGLRQSFSEPPTLVRIDLRSGAAVKLSSFNDDILAKVDFGRVESVTYKGAKDADIQMWVIYPPNFDPSKRWPLFLALHGGPHNAITDSWTYRWNAHVFAGWGYVVAWHNFHGSSGFGNAFTDSITANWADLPYEDTIKAAGYFQAQPWIDDDRMIAAGASYGGYLATLLLGRPHPFQALVAHAPVFNRFTQLAADSWAAQPRYAPYWEDLQSFLHDSPHMAAANFKTPTLVIHGQRDLRVPVNHGFELFQILQQRRVPSRLVYYPNENHWILNAQNSLNWYGEVRRWVESYAKPGAQ